jgi:hypothetical protein
MEKNMEKSNVRTVNAKSQTFFTASFFVKVFVVLLFLYALEYKFQILNRNTAKNEKTIPQRAKLGGVGDSREATDEIQSMINAVNCTVFVL